MVVYLYLWNLFSLRLTDVRPPGFVFAWGLDGVRWFLECRKHRVTHAYLLEGPYLVEGNVLDVLLSWVEAKALVDLATQLRHSLLLYELYLELQSDEFLDETLLPHLDARLKPLASLVAQMVY